MVDISAMSAALSSLKAAKDIAEAMVGLRDAAAFQGKLLEFQSKLIDANNAAFAAQDERTAMLERIRDLEEKVRRFEAWESEKQRYQLHSLPPGILIRRLKPGMENGEPPHEICANCYAKGVKSPLHNLGQVNGLTHWKCHSCGFHEQSGHFTAPIVNTRNPYV